MIMVLFFPSSILFFPWNSFKIGWTTVSTHKHDERHFDRKKEILNSAARSNTITPYLHVAGYYFTSVLDTIFWMNLLLVAFVSTQYFFNWYKTGSWSISCLEVKKISDKSKMWTWRLSKTFLSLEEGEISHDSSH